MSEETETEADDTEVSDETGDGEETSARDNLRNAGEEVGDAKTDLPDPEAPARPEYIDEKFFNKEKNEVDYQGQIEHERKRRDDWRNKYQTAVAAKTGTSDLKSADDYFTDGALEELEQKYGISKDAPQLKAIRERLFEQRFSKDVVEETYLAVAAHMVEAAEDEREKVRKANTVNGKVLTPTEFLTELTKEFGGDKVTAQQVVRDQAQLLDSEVAKGRMTDADAEVIASHIAQSPRFAKSFDNFLRARMGEKPLPDGKGSTAPGLPSRATYEKLLDEIQSLPEDTPDHTREAMEEKARKLLKRLHGAR